MCFVALEWENWFCFGIFVEVLERLLVLYINFAPALLHISREHFWAGKLPDVLVSIDLSLALCLGVV